MPDTAAGVLFGSRDVERVVRRERRQSLRRCRRQEHPEAILLAGQPGAGKTELTALMADRFDDSCMSVNGDDYRRFHPEHGDIIKKYGNEAADCFSLFSSAVTERLIDVLSDEGFNLIIEGTGRTVEVPEKTAKLLSKKGYRVEIAALAVNPASSLLSIAIRFYRMCELGTAPRITSIEAHDHVVKVLPSNLDYLADCEYISDISIWNRNMECLYRRSECGLPPSEVLTEQWKRPLQENELSWMRKMYSDILDIENEKKLGQMELLKEIESRLNCG